MPYDEDDSPSLAWKEVIKGKAEIAEHLPIGELIRWENAARRNIRANRFTAKVSKVVTRGSAISAMVIAESDIFDLVPSNQVRKAAAFGITAAVGYAFGRVADNNVATVQPALNALQQEQATRFESAPIVNNPTAEAKIL